MRNQNCQDVQPIDRVVSIPTLILIPIPNPLLIIRAWVGKPGLSGHLRAVEPMRHEGTRVPQMWLVPLPHIVSRSCNVVLPNFAIGGVKVDHSNWTG
jgi:hypothetical protein